MNEHKRESRVSGTPTQEQLDVFEACGIEVHQDGGSYVYSTTDSQLQVIGHKIADKRLADAKADYDRHTAYLRSENSGDGISNVLGDQAHMGQSGQPGQPDEESGTSVQMPTIPETPPTEVTDSTPAVPNEPTPPAEAEKSSAQLIAEEMKKKKK